MQQEEALRVLKMGHSAYIAGEPGSGKSHLLRRFCKWLDKKGIGYASTASTGIAATHIGGRTIHSFSGIGVKRSMGEKELDRMEQRRDLWQRFHKTRVIIIDEVSMLSGHFIDMLDLVCRTMKRRNIPFGGIQMVFCGDFFQLPPIEGGGYAFQSTSWKELFPLSCYLSSQYRQRDNKLSSVLLCIRERKNLQKVEKMLSGRILKSQGKVTRLFTHNIDVDSLNEERLENLSGKRRVFDMLKKGSKWHVEAMLKSSLVPQELHLKEGAEVMFTKNEPSQGYMNGTRGTVVGFREESVLVRLRDGKRVEARYSSFKREEEGKLLAELKQIPLRLAWAVTVHKSQGMTLDEADMDLGQCFVPGQGYVALSRVRSLDGLYLQSLSEMALAVDERVAQADETFKKHSFFIRERLKKLSRKDEKKYRDNFISEKG